MAKKRIYEVAKEVGVDNKVVVQKAKELGFDVKNHMSSIDDAQVAKLKGGFQNSAPAEKNNKIKISVSSIRKNEKKQEDNAGSKKPRRHNNKRRQNNDRNHKNRNDRDHSANSGSGKPKAAALLQQFKQKQRAEEGQLNRQAQKAKKEYHEQLKYPKKEQPVNNKKKTNKESNNKKSEEVEKKVIGPKIL
ncbi:MAG: translation initiation factor IF-2 N-terminal domain-containing protein, partial [Lactobacillus sp.]